MISTRPAVEVPSSRAYISASGRQIRQCTTRDGKSGNRLRERGGSGKYALGETVMSRKGHRESFLIKLQPIKISIPYQISRQNFPNPELPDRFSAERYPLEGKDPVPEGGEMMKNGACLQDKGDQGGSGSTAKTPHRLTSPKETAGSGNPGLPLRMQEMEF